MKLIKIFFLFLISGSAFSQSKSDTLRTLLTSSDHNRKVEACSELAWELRHVNIDTALKYALQAEKWLSNETSSKVRSYVYHIIGAVYSVRKDYTIATPWLEKAYEIRKKEGDTQQLVATVSALAFSAQASGDMKRMLQYAMESEQVSELVAARDPHLYIITLDQLANLYSDLRRHEKSVELREKIIKLAEKTKSNDDLCLVYQNYGTYLIGVGEYKKALPYLEKGIHYQELLNQPDELFTAKVNLAIVYAETGRKEEAGKIFREIYEYHKKNGADYDKSTSANNLAFFHFIDGKYHEAIKLFHESLEHALAAKASRLIQERYGMLSESYENIKKYDQALKYHKLYLEMKDSLFNEETIKQLNELTEKYGTEKKEKQILELEKNNAEIKLKEEEAKRASQRNTIIFGGIIAMVLVILVFIYISFLQKKKANSVLTLKNKEIERQNVLLEEKQKEILDSIHYAKRIQQSLMPTEKYFKKKIDELQKK